MFTTIENQFSGINFLQTEFAEIKTNLITGNRSLLSKKTFKKGDVISPFYWDKIYDKPNYLTIQIADNQHVELLPKVLECTNHSCDPNAFFDTTNKQLICIKSIKKGEEITFFYPSAEWDMNQSFVCNCGAKQCMGTIKGAKYLPKNALKNYQFTDFIQQKLKANN
jgi:SET domain